MNENKAPLQSFDPYIFGKRMQSTRKKLNITQKGLADMLHLDYSYISHLERGNKCCSFDILIAMAALFNVSTDYLLLGKRVENSETLKKSLLIIIEELNEIVRNL